MISVVTLTHVIVCEADSGSLEGYVKPFTMTLSRLLLSVVLSHDVLYQFKPLPSPEPLLVLAVTPDAANLFLPSTVFCVVFTLSPSVRGLPMVMVGIRASGSLTLSVSVDAASLFSSGSVSVKSAVSTGSHASPASNEIDASS